MVSHVVQPRKVVERFHLTNYFVVVSPEGESWIRKESLDSVGHGGEVIITVLGDGSNFVN
jgi:hypothetical protein